MASICLEREGGIKLIPLGNLLLLKGGGVETKPLRKNEAPQTTTSR